MIRGAQLLLTVALLGALTACGEATEGIALSGEPATAAADAPGQDDEPAEEPAEEVDETAPASSSTAPGGTRPGQDATAGTEPAARQTPSSPGDDEPQPAAGPSAPIEVDSPEAGAALGRGPITVTGTSLTYESTVVLELLGPDGEHVETSFTTAHQPAVDERGPFRHTFETPADRPGTWTIRALEPDASNGEGPPAYHVEVEVTVE